MTSDEGSIVDRDHVRINYRIEGHGLPVVVFVHGLVGCVHEWDRTVAALSSHATTITLDQRGHGASTRHPADLSREAFAADVVAVIKDAQVRWPVTLVGQSMGAHTAFLTAAWYPEFVDRLVMIDLDVGGGGQTAAQRLDENMGGLPIQTDSYQELTRFFGGDHEVARARAAAYERGPAGWQSRFDPDVMRAAMAPVFATEQWQEWRQTPGSRCHITSGRREHPDRIKLPN